MDSFVCSRRQSSHSRAGAVTAGYEDIEPGSQDPPRRGACAGRKVRANLNGGKPAIELENLFKEIAGFVALAIEAAAVLVVSYGAIQALAGVLASAFSRTADEMRGRAIWTPIRHLDPACPRIRPCPPISFARR